jgi:hypothetical protein
MEVSEDVYQILQINVMYKHQILHKWNCRQFSL